MEVFNQLYTFDPQMFSSFSSIFVKDNQKQIFASLIKNIADFCFLSSFQNLTKLWRLIPCILFHSSILHDIVLWFIVYHGLVVVNWQEKICTAVTDVSQTSLGVVEDMFPPKIHFFLPKRWILFKMLIFWLEMKWDGVILPALINMKLA